MVYDTLIQNEGGGINAEQLCSGLQTANGQPIDQAEMDFAIEVLDLLQEGGPFQSAGVSFEQFMMAGELMQCVDNLSPEVRKMISCENLAARKRQVILMFFMDADDDCTISLDALGVLMDAGRVDTRQKYFVLDQLAAHGESINLLQYLAHLPLFLNLHHDIVENTLNDERRLV
jgi:hypothetical protein